MAWVGEREAPKSSMEDDCSTQPSEPLIFRTESSDRPMVESIRFSSPAMAKEPMTEESVAPKMMVPCWVGEEPNMSASIVGPQYCSVSVGSNGLRQT